MSYRERELFSFGPRGSAPGQGFGEIAVGPFHFTLGDHEADFFFEADFSLHLGLGAGFSMQSSYADPHFEGPFEVERGEE